MRLRFMGWIGGGLLAGCGSRDCEVEVGYTDSAHNVKLAFDRVPADATVEYGYAADLDRSASIQEEDGEPVASLNGLPPLQEIAYRVMDGDREECVGSFTTQNLPSDLPYITVSGYDEGATADWDLLAGVAMGENPTLFVMDRLGNWLWHRSHGTDVGSSEVLVDGQEILYNTFSANHTEDVGRVHRLNLNGAEIDSVRTVGAHHVFALLPDDTIAFPSVDIRQWDDPELGVPVWVVGDRILEKAPDGSVREVFNLWDHEEPTKHDNWDSTFYPQGHDWSHANSLHYSPERGSYLLSLNNLHTVYEVDRATGEVMNRFVPESVEEGGLQFHHQHDVHWTADGTLMMISYPVGLITAVEYELSGDGSGSPTLREVWSYEQVKDGVALMGQAQRLENGNTFLNFGWDGRILEIDPGGEVVWQAEAGLGNWFGNASRLSGWFEIDPTTPGLP